METSAKRRDQLITGLILLVALIARLWHLGGKSLWIDEGASLEFAGRSIWGILGNVKEPNPPLYYLLLHGWIRLFGISEVALRSLSVLFGVLGVACIGWVARRLGGRRLAWVAMALMAIMPMPVQYSQMARAYSLFIAVSLASYGSLLAWLETRRPRWAAAYVLSTTLMCYAHNYWVFNLLAQQLYVGWLILKHRVPLRPWAGLTAAALAGFAPWLVVLVRQTVEIEQGGFWLAKPSVSQLFQTLAQYTTFDATTSMVWCSLMPVGFGLLATQRVRVPWNWPGRALLPGLQAGGQVVGRGRRNGLLLLWMLSPLLVPFALSRVGQHAIFHQRYTVAAAPALYLLLGQGILSLHSRLSRAVVLTALAGLAITSLPAYYTAEPENWRGLVSHLERALRQDDALVVSSSRISPFTYYYRGTVGFEALPSRVGQSRDTRQAFRARMDGMLSGRRRLWMVVRGSKRHLQERLALPEVLGQEYPHLRPAYRKQFGCNLSLLGYAAPTGLALTVSESP